jgi:hypothetical protein
LLRITVCSSVVLFCNDEFSSSDLVREFAFYVSCYDLFNDDGFSLVKDIRDLWKHEVRMWMSEIVTNKYFDIADLFGSSIRYKFEDFLIPNYVHGLKETLIRIRNNLDEYIGQLQD